MTDCASLRSAVLDATACTQWKESAHTVGQMVGCDGGEQEADLGEVIRQGVQRNLLWEQWQDLRIACKEEEEQVEARMRKKMQRRTLDG